MIKTNYKYSSIKLDDLKCYEDKLNEINDLFQNKKCKGNDFLGWYTYPVNIDEKIISRIDRDSKLIKETSDVLVVCGIGGSYLGSRAVIESIQGFKNAESLRRRGRCPQRPTHLGQTLQVAGAS